MSDDKHWGEKLQEKLNYWADAPKRSREKHSRKNRIFATFNDRLFASVIDMTILYILLRHLFSWMDAQLGVLVDHHILRSALNSIAQSLVIAPIMIAIWTQTHSTPGKFLLGLELRGANGEGLPSKSQYIRRYVGFYLSLPIFMIGFIALAFDDKKRAWHDRIAGTTVVYSEQGHILSILWRWVKQQFKR